MKFYYHWIRGEVDFIRLDNTSEDQFDDSQMGWFAVQLDRDSACQNTEALRPSRSRLKACLGARPYRTT